MVEAGKSVDQEEQQLFSHKLILSKQVEPSFRILYYGDAPGSIPFNWESQPGTPKHTFSDASLPPLTPPPSYQSRRQTSGVHHDLKRSKSSFLGAIFSSNKSSHVSPSSLSWSSSSSPLNWSLAKRTTSRSAPSGVFLEEEEKELGGNEAADVGRSWVSNSTLCFGVRPDGVSRKWQGRRRLNKVRNALMSVVGHYRG